MAVFHCKQSGAHRRDRLDDGAGTRGPRARLRTTLLTGISGLLALSACRVPQQVHLISLPTLEQAPAVELIPIGQAVLGDPVQLAAAYTPLSSRMGVYQIRTQDDWHALTRLAPQLGPCPPLDGGLVVAFASRIGTPLRHDWPVRIERARVVAGGVLVEAHFNGGNFLPDGTTYIDAAYISGGRDLLAVEVNGVSFVPDTSRQPHPSSAISFR